MSEMPVQSVEQRVSAETVQYPCSLATTVPSRTRSIPTRAYMRSSRTTLERMLDAAAEMFSRKGFAATTFRDVASEGAINNNTIFRRMVNKADLAKQAMHWESEKISFARQLN